MSDGRDEWILSSWEQECCDEIEQGLDVTEQIQRDRDIFAQKLWLHFQNAATAIAQLYKDRHQGLWLPFQSSAGAVTAMYKESLDSHRRGLDLGIHMGSQRRTREIVAWARKRRQHIKREDLLAFLAGKTVAPRSNHSWSFTTQPHNEVASGGEGEEDLETFKEAIALSSLNGAMSNITVGRKSHNPSSPLSSRRRNGLAELNSFISDEFKLHHDGSRKRNNSSESPTHKRSRLM